MDHGLEGMENCKWALFAAFVFSPFADPVGVGDSIAGRRLYVCYTSILFP